MLKIINNLILRTNLYLRINCKSYFHNQIMLNKIFNNIFFINFYPKIIKKDFVNKTKLNFLKIFS